MDPWSSLNVAKRNGVARKYSICKKMQKPCKNLLHYIFFYAIMLNCSENGPLMHQRDRIKNIC